MKIIKYFKVAFGVVFAVLGCILVFSYQGEYKVTPVQLSKVKKVKRLNSLRNNKIVKTKFHMGIGNKNSFGIELAIPYEKRGQRQRLWKNSSRIKNDFLMDVGEEDLKKWVEKRDYKAIKSKFLQIVNRYMDEPINVVYLDNILIE